MPGLASVLFVVAHDNRVFRFFLGHHKENIHTGKINVYLVVNLDMYSENQAKLA